MSSGMKYWVSSPSAFLIFMAIGFPFASNSWESIRPFLNGKLPALTDRHMVEPIETLGQAGELQALMRCRHPYLWDDLGGGSLAVAPDRILEVGREVVAHDPKSGGFGRGDIPGALGDGRVGVVHDERLLGGKARVHQDLLAVPRLEHIQIDADVRISEALVVEGGLPHRLNANKDYGFHRYQCSTFALVRHEYAVLVFGRKPGTAVLEPTVRPIMNVNKWFLTPAQRRRMKSDGK